MLVAALLIVSSWYQDDGVLERAQAGGVLRVGLDASFPPFETLDDAGNIVGYDVDLARLVATRLGARPEFVNIAFDSLYDALQAGRVDVLIASLTYDPRRTQDVRYSQSYFNGGQLLVVRAGESGAPEQGKTPSEWLAGRRVAVEWGSMGDTQARHFQPIAPGMEVLPYSTAQEALDALVAGRADGVVADAVSVYQYVSSRRNAVRIIATLTDESYAIAVRFKSRRLAEAIDAAMGELRQSGTLDALRDRWMQSASGSPYP